MSLFKKRSVKHSSSGRGNLLDQIKNLYSSRFVAKESVFDTEKVFIKRNKKF